MWLLHETHAVRGEAEAEFDAALRDVWIPRVAETKGMVSICFPAATIESMEEKFAQGWHRTMRQPTPL